MFFLQPLALFGLAAAVVPPLLHLFRRREPPDVTFPAVRYLRQTEREAERAIRLRHLVLMLLRVLAVALIVLAAARPVVPVAAFGAHAPSALGIVLDNSLSSGAVSGGSRVYDDLARRARETLRAVRQGDAVWLIAADGIARRGSPEELIERVANLAPEARRLDLSAAVALAARLVRSSGYARGEVHVLSDMQKTAVSREPRAATGQPPEDDLSGMRVLFYHPEVEPPANRAVVSAEPQPATWVGGRGDVAVSVGGAPAPPGGRVAAAAVVEGREGGRALVGPGDAVVLAASASRTGWLVGEVSLPADELRADDHRFFAVRVATPPVVAVEPGADPGRFVSEALAVLAERGRVVTAGGSPDVVLGETARRGAMVVFPPHDVVRIGAANRALEAMGVGWRFGGRVEGEDTLASRVLSGLSGIRVLSRYRLDPVGSAGEPGVLARAGREPWLVRTERIVVLGSRLVPEETSLPLSGTFVPFVEALVARLARGEEGIVEAAPGGPVVIGDRVTALALGADSVARVEGGSVITAPPVPGVYPLLDGTDTAGVLVVGPDWRESDLRRADAGDVHAAFPGARVQITSTPRDYAARRFEGAGQSELTPWLLLAALLALGAEALAAAGVSAHRT